MSRRGGRPRTFPSEVVSKAVERRERTREPWAAIARELHVNPGTLRARASDIRRGLGVHKTPTVALINSAPPSDTFAAEPVAAAAPTTAPPRIHLQVPTVETLAPGPGSRALQFGRTGPGSNRRGATRETEASCRKEVHDGRNQSSGGNSSAGNQFERSDEAGSTERTVAGSEEGALDR
jgi:hypothetical protein